MEESDFNISKSISISNCSYTGKNCIIPEYMQNSYLVELLIDNACYALNSERVSNIFDPIPETWKLANIKAENAITYFNLCTDSQKIISYITSSNSDEDLIAKIGENTYGFIKFVISTSQSINIIPCKLFAFISAPSMPNMISYRGQYEFKYTKDKEYIFTTQKTVYLYHGSPYENWYGISRLGIKIGSKNKKLFLNGAAYGDGIYLSNDINLSLGYCSIHHSGSTSKSNTNPNNYRVLAIYEVLDNPKWKKTNNIFVIDDENALILRYLIILNNYSLPSEICTALNDKLQSGKLKELSVEKAKQADIAISKAYSKRLMMEYKKLIKSNIAELGFTMKLAEEDNLRKWQLFIHNVDNCKLASQMANLNIPYIEMEFTFPEGYPIEPPFIRIIHPHFKSLTGHITIGGSICMEAISKNGWIPTTSVESLITQIKLILSDGGADIDETNYNKKYNMADAKEAFERAMKLHGWD